MKTRILIPAMLILMMNPLKNVFGNERFNIYGTAGAPEFFNIGIRLQGDQQQFGVGGLYWHSHSARVISISTDIMNHFAGKSGLSDRKPAYFRININFVRMGYREVYEFGELAKEEGADASLNLNVRFGRDINITRIIGFALDIGPGVRMKMLEYRTPKFDLDSPIIIGGSITLFVRFNSKPGS